MSDDDEWKVVRRRGRREPSVTMDAIRAKRRARDVEEKAKERSAHNSRFTTLALDFPLIVVGHPGRFPSLCTNVCLA